MRTTAFAIVLSCASYALGQAGTVTARAVVTDGHKRSAENVVIWLKPSDPATAKARWPKEHYTLTQRNKSFEPHLLIVPVGALVEFPNRDPFFHNVFSLFEGKKFDLGLYEAGSTRYVRFDKPGISYIFCNIHAQMSAVVIALDTPYYGISNRQGAIVIPNVPSGEYTMQVWYESATVESLKSLARKVKVEESGATLGVVRVRAANLPAAHKNMYGQDYDPPPSDSPVYEP